MARLTTIGASLIAAAVGSGPKLDITKFVFANIPGLVHTDAEPADEPMPEPEHIVFERAPTKAGIIDANRVTYSQMMLTDVGDFYFNWIGLVYTDPEDGDQLVMFAYVPLTQKVKTEGASAGNVLTRNLVIEHLGIANATPVVVSAESWMFDFVGYVNEELSKAPGKNGVENEELTATRSVDKLARHSVYVNKAAANSTITFDSSTYAEGDTVEISKMKLAGQMDFRVSSGNIIMPDGSTDNAPYIPNGKIGTARMRFDGTNWEAYY